MKDYLIYPVVFLVGLVIGYLADKLIELFSHPSEERENKSVACLQKYHVVKVFTAIIITTLFAKFGATIYFVSFTYLFAVLIAISFIDMKQRIIPNKLVMAAIIGGLPIAVTNFINPLREIYEYDRWAPVTGFFSGSGILLLFALLGAIIYKSDDAMGMGDVKLMAPIGLYLGWRLCILSLAASIVVAGVVSVFLVLLKIKGRKDTIPFGPFIALGTYIAIICS